ncbi:DUF3881 family protein [Cellulosilyticum sp. ST5]|uniref:DUF3881 family protein n=1 Tax=Cellulosilyticum lentocellum (strain ATCC 49066 / DSM 5427 / NCIMB 11756 / RHM5) TaxID=642492 RepID=F2JQ76_CELLD|nr:DUF3881 family protein [Cellulosilyticum lentocellum]ADZ82624.1 hypothetical protein Clole_0891 [Cellulosilyticum lentocellum DSM 5427]
MESPIAAIGFSDIEKKYNLEKIVSGILDKPTKQVASRKANQDIIAEYLKEFGKDMYVMVRIVVRADQKDTKLEIEQCEPYLSSHYTVKVEDLSVECIDDEYNYYAICEEAETGMQFIFWLQNVVEYTEAVEMMQTFNEVQIAALAMEGTVVLPIEKDEEDEAVEKEEREKIKVMLQKAREGDEDARAKLEEEEKELDDQLKERMFEEDFLSIMSGYFVPTTLVDATYAILGEITDIQNRKNTQTGEESYLFTLDVNDMPLEVLINKANLVGYPSIGMRFMGTCWLQGTIVTSK